ncbi:MAG: ABC transporter ATP-binding protein [Eubacteriales bacterium]|nr:ABC transporter ATP-binding protein [Eubacteriales bacterium]
MAFKLYVKGLSKSWAGLRTLEDVSFEQPQGSIYGIAGENGAGKSTLLKILASVLPRDSGSVFFGHEKVNASTEGDRYCVSLDDLNRWRELIAYVPQELALDDRLTVRETLSFWTAARGLSSSERKEQIELAAADPLISEFLDKLIRECSGGMARRVSLIVGLLGDPQLILLDEPFAGADNHSRQLMFERLSQLRSDGKTILVSAHEGEVLEQLSNRILHLHEGKLRDALPNNT